MMNHIEAIELKAVDRYLLNELPPEQRDEFEGHLFDCHECAAEMRATAAFLDAARVEMQFQVGAKPKKNSSQQRFSSLTAVFLASALAASLLVILFQNMVTYPRMQKQIAQLQQPRILSTLALVGGISRGEKIPALATNGRQPFILQVDIPADDKFSSYACQLLSPEGKSLWSIQVNPLAARDTVALNVPPVSRGGTYMLVIQGSGAEAPLIEIARRKFNLIIQQ